jgi:Ca2+-binding EF-hand superfamily protein
MRILDQDNDKKVNNILLLLTTSEAVELKDELERLLDSSQKDDHGHINDNDFVREVSLAIYDENNIIRFDDRIQKLIIDDE